MVGDEAGQRHRQVEAQARVRQFTPRTKFLFEPGASLQHLENEFLVFAASAADQHFEVFEGGRFDDFVPIAGVNVEDTAGHVPAQFGLGRADVADAADWLSALGHGASLASAPGAAQDGNASSVLRASLGAEGASEVAGGAGSSRPGPAGVGEPPLLQEPAGAVATARSIAAMSIFCIWNMACSAR